MTDDDIISHGVVEEPVKDEQSLQTPENQREDDDDEDEDTDTDDGAVGDDEDIDGIFILGILLTVTWVLDYNCAAQSNAH